MRIKRVDLPEQNSKSVFDRMRAERQREAAEFRGQGAGEANRIKATADREATVIRAEASRKGEETRGAGDAERNKIYADAYTRDPEFFEFYRSMQAYERGLRVFRHAAVDHSQFGFLQVFRRPARPRGQTGDRSGRSARAAMNDLIVGFGLVLVIEGLLWALAPHLAMRFLEGASATPESTLRIAGVDGGRHWGRPRLAYPRLTVGSR